MYNFKLQPGKLTQKASWGNRLPLPQSLPHSPAHTPVGMHTLVQLTLVHTHAHALVPVHLCKHLHLLMCTHSRACFGRRE